MSDRFSMRRFWTMLRHDYDHNIVSWIGLPLGVFGGLLASEAGLSLVDISTVGEFTDAVSIVLRMFYMLALVIMGSFMFDKMQTRHGQIAYLTLPATAFEKYLVNWVETVVATFVSFVVGVVAADAVRVAFSMMLGSDPEFCTMIMTQVFVGDYVLPWTSTFLWLQSIMMIASALWRKKTLVRGLALLVVVVILTDCAINVLQLTNQIKIIVLITLTVINYVITYRIFAKTQIR